MKNKDLPLRIGVGIVVLNSKNQVFVGKRKDNPFDKWQMPQGGVDLDEPLLVAMKRELKEETSIKNIEVLKEFDQWFEYELPENLIGKIWKGKYRGQKQKWFIVRFIGLENEININTKYPEFIEWKWINMILLPDLIVSFKKNIYKKVLDELKKYINQSLEEN
jgi:putative (di)nucleoside polyphosphate hydrolase